MFVLRDQGDSTSSEIKSTCSSSGSSSSSSKCSSTSSKAIQRPSSKTLDSYVCYTFGKESWEGIRKAIREKTATLVATAHLPYRFVEHEALKNFAQAFVELGASHGCVPASEFIVGRLTVHKDIVSKLPHIQATINSSLRESAEVGAVSVVTGLWSDNIVSHSYVP